VESIGASRVADNVASAYGGGLYLHSAELVGALVEANDAGLGAGGVQIVEGGLLERVVVSGNVAPLGGGLTVNGQATLQLVETTITANTATTTAGGVHAITATIEADPLTLVTGNNAVQDGGGVELFEATWEGGTISFNSASEGGGVHVGAGAGLSSLVSATVVDNVAVLSSDDPPVASGGGVWSAGFLDVVDSTIDRNLSDLRGAGLYATLDARVNVTDTTFDSNAALERGGGIYANGDALITCTACIIERNQAIRGAGLYNNDNAATTLTDSTVARNGSALTVSGGGARVTDGVVFSSCTDWGSGAGDNAADDLFVEGDGPYVGYGSCETFSCSAADGCSPAP
jgi:predicted outer membrane repeat protein